MKEATQRQKEVLDFIARFVHEHGYSPSIREVADHLSISVKGAHDHLTALKKKGLLTHGDNKPRTLGLVKALEENDLAEIPVLGTVAAGRPILSTENMEGSIKLHRSMLKKNGQYFALYVRGDSMEDAGIMDGDTAIIEQQTTVRNGDIAVVMLDDSVTLKTFYQESTRIKLEPANPKYSPIYCSGDLRVLGKLAHIIRSYA